MYIYNIWGGHVTIAIGSYHGQHEDSRWWGGHKPIFVHHRSRRLGQLNSSSQVHNGLLERETSQGKHCSPPYVHVFSNMAVAIGFLQLLYTPLITLVNLLGVVLPITRLHDFTCPMLSLHHFLGNLSRMWASWTLASQPLNLQCFFARAGWHYTNAIRNRCPAMWHCDRKWKVWSFHSKFAHFSPGASTCITHSSASSLQHPASEQRNCLGSFERQILFMAERSWNTKNFSGSSLQLRRHGFFETASAVNLADQNGAACGTGAEDPIPFAPESPGMGIRK